MKKMMLGLMLIMILTSHFSCMTTRTTVGDGPIGKRGRTEVYSSSKQLYLFWGLMPLGYASPRTPNHNNLQVKTSVNVVDSIISLLTGGIVSAQTVKIIVKKE